MIRKNLTYIFAAALLVVCSCVDNKSWDDEPSVSTGDGDKSFNLLAAPYTRASVSQEDYSVEWTAGDKVSLLDGKQNREFTTSEGGDMAKFSGYASAADAYYAVYPYNASALLTDDVLSFEFPQQQTEVAGTLPNPLSSVWAGKSRGSLVVMNNLCATLTFSFAQTDVTSVTVTGNRSEKLSGTAYVTIEEDSPVLTTSQLTGESVVLLPAEDEVFAAGTHAVSLLPGDFPDGLSLTFVRADGQQPVVKKINTVSILAASSVTNLGSLDLDAPELKSVSLTEDAVASGSGAVLNASMDIVRFKADRVSCGFEYRFSEQTPWTTVTCETPAETFSYTLKGLPYSSEPVSYRSWAMVDGYKVYSQEVKTFTMLQPLILDFSFLNENINQMAPIFEEWGFLTNGKMFNNKTDEEKALLNSKDWEYSIDGNKYLFRFWCNPSDAGYCIRAITIDSQNKIYSYHGVCLNYTSGEKYSWVMLPSVDNARLINAEVTLYDKQSKLTLASFVSDNGIPDDDYKIVTAKSEDKYYGTISLECPDSDFSKRYYLSSTVGRTTVCAMRLTFQYE